VDLINQKKLTKLKKKNKSNKKLVLEINEFIKTIKATKWENVQEMQEERGDADHICENRFYFFDLNVHRTFCLVDFEDDELEVLWVGSHDEYKNTFKNNKNTIKKWLRAKNYIE